MSIFLISATVSSHVVLPIEADDQVEAGAMAIELIEIGRYAISGQPEQGCVAQIDSVQNWTKAADEADRRTAQENAQHYEDLSEENDDDPGL